VETLIYERFRWISKPFRGSGTIITLRVDHATDSMKSVFLDRYRQLGHDLTGDEAPSKSLRVNTLKAESEWLLERLRQVRGRALSLTAKGPWTVIDGDRHWRIIHRQLMELIGL